jgi:hypothetical protein
MTEEHTLQSMVHVFRAIKDGGDRALAQLTLEDLTRIAGPECNSIAVIVRHLHGNMLSRWTDFLNSDGEKPTRDRDAEFEPPPVQLKDDVLKLWEDGWRCVLGELEKLKPGDLLRTVTIRGQPHTVVEAAHRQLQHYSYHIGQIVLLAKLYKGADWKTLSIARGQSRQYRPQGKSGEPDPKSR